MVIQLGLFDDHDIVRAGFRHALEKHADLSVAVEGASGREALAAVRRHHLDVCLVDMMMPDLSGLDVLRHMKALRPAMGILILSSYSEEQYGLSVLKAGANGFLSKGISPTELLRAVRAAAVGRRYVSSTLADRLAAGLSEDIETPLHVKLSAREFQIFIKLVCGRCIVDIAQELFLSAKTVSTYRSRLLKKMHVNSNAELTHYAVRHRLIE